MTNATLMGLPAEVRCLILQHCLSSAASLRRGLLQKSGEVTLDKESFRPDVSLLRTCRILHNEGIPILYANTFALDARVLEAEGAPARFCTAMFYNKRLHLCDNKNTIPRHLRLQASKVDVNIVFESGDGESWFLNELVSRLVVTLSENPQWTILSIKLTLNGVERDDTQFYVDAACNVFKYLRGRQGVTLQGLSAVHASTLIELMQSHDPVVNLASMYQKLISFVHDLESHRPNVMDDDIVSDYLYECWLARDAGLDAEDSVKKFYQAREAMLKYLETKGLDKTATVFEADPPAAIQS